MCDTHEPPRKPTVFATVMEADSVDATSVDTEGDAEQSLDVSASYRREAEQSLKFDLNMVSRRLDHKR